MPAATPVTMPLVDPIVARVVLPLSHVPPPMASVNVIVEPMHTDVGPAMGASALIVSVLVAKQPVGKV